MALVKSFYQIPDKRLYIGKSPILSTEMAAWPENRSE
jgi:hypothetical protein